MMIWNFWQGIGKQQGFIQPDDGTRGMVGSAHHVFSQRVECLDTQRPGVSGFHQPGFVANHAYRSPGSVVPDGMQNIPPFVMRI